MLSKGSIALLPFILLGLSAWRRRIAVADLLRMMPFFAIAGVLVIVNVLFQNHGSAEAIRIASPLQRLLGAGAVLWFYLYKAVLPFRLAFIYPLWQIEPRVVFWWLPLLGAVSLTLGLFFFRDRKGKPWFYAWIFFALSLVPVMGFTDITFMRYSLVADHYQHLAILAPLVLASFGLYHWHERTQGNARLLATAATIGLISLFGGLTFAQCRIYKDEETLYRAIIETNSSCWMAYGNLGRVKVDAGDTQEAIHHFRQALLIQPDAAEVRNNLGMILGELGRFDEAVIEFTTALRSHPALVDLHINLATIYHHQGRLSEARAQLGEAIRLRPKNAEAHDNLGNLLDEMGQTDAAVVEYERALDLNPASALAHFNLGNTFFRAGRLNEAIIHYERTLELDSTNEVACKRLGMAYAEANQVPKAIAQLEQCLRLRSDDGEAYDVLGIILSDAGQTEKAAELFERAVQLHPEMAQLHDHLGRALQTIGRLKEAQTQFTLSGRNSGAPR